MICIIDDDPWARSGLEELVLALGFPTRTFESAQQFVESDAVADTSCVITDVQMPGLSGLELQSRLRGEGHKTPVIFVTAYPNENLSPACLCGWCYRLLDQALRRPFAGRLPPARDGGVAISPSSPALPERRACFACQIANQTDENERRQGCGASRCLLRSEVSSSRRNSPTRSDSPSRPRRAAARSDNRRRRCTRSHRDKSCRSKRPLRCRGLLPRPRRASGPSQAYPNLLRHPSPDGLLHPSLGGLRPIQDGSPDQPRPSLGARCRHWPIGRRQRLQSPRCEIRRLQSRRGTRHRQNRRRESLHPQNLRRHGNHRRPSSTAPIARPPHCSISGASSSAATERTNNRLMILS